MLAIAIASPKTTPRMPETLFCLVLANRPFAGALDDEATAKDLQRIVKTKKTELLVPRAVPAAALVRWRSLQLIVPDGGAVRLLKGAQGSAPLLARENKLDAVIKGRSGGFLA